MSQIEEVRQVLARYVRAADYRDGTAMADLFVTDGRVVIFHRDDEELVRIGELEGKAVIAQAVATMMPPHPPRGWSHHVTHDHIIHVDGDHAEMDAQFVMFETCGAERPANGWPADAGGVQGHVRPIEAGYYRSSLRRVDGRWLFVEQRIEHDLPFALPGA